MVKEITAYRVSNGKLYTNKEEAVLADARAQLLQIFESESVLDLDPDEEETEEVIDCLLKNARMISEIAAPYLAMLEDKDENAAKEHMPQNG